MGLGEGRHDDPPAGIECPNVALGGWQDYPVTPEHDAAQALAADPGLLDDDAVVARARRHATHCATRLEQDERTRERGTSMESDPGLGRRFTGELRVRQQQGQEGFSMGRRYALDEGTGVGRKRASFREGTSEAAMGYAQALRDIRDARAETQEELGRLLGWSAPVVSRFEAASERPDATTHGR